MLRPGCGGFYLQAVDLLLERDQPLVGLAEPVAEVVAPGRLDVVRLLRVVGQVDCKRAGRVGL